MESIEHIESILEAGVAEAEALGFPVVVECSDRSEARYLHVDRGEAWFGYRIACHEPFHACSADYQQILAPHRPLEDVVHRAMTFLRLAVRTGGSVIADPREVESALAAARQAKLQRMRVMDEDGREWIWCNDDSAWVCRTPGEKPLAPPPLPRVRLSARVECEIRHRLNYRARWSHEESRRYKPPAISRQSR